MDRKINEEEIVKEASKCFNCKIAKCQEFCPIHNNIPLFNKLVKEFKFNQAFDVIKNNTIFPDICSLICPHEKQCEGHCIRNKNNDGVKIGLIENYISSYKIVESCNKNNFKVCTIGSGPASLAFALYLARKGYHVDIYEKENDIGGVLYWGIPHYRLNKSILNNYKNELINLGTNIYANKTINSLDNIINKYDAIFIGVGTTAANKMKIKGENLIGVYNAYDFLKDTNLSINHKNYGKNIIVVGGGNVAIDAARNAKRLNSNVTIIYRRSENEMPANREEIKLAKEEGINFMCLRNPISILGDNKVEKIECAIMELGPLDSSNRPTPIESNKSHIFIDADSVIMAIGFNFDNSFKEINKNEKGYIKVDLNNLTNINNVYAGGDATTGSKTVVLAMKSGLNAAKHLDKKLFL